MEDNEENDEPDIFYSCTTVSDLSETSKMLKSFEVSNDLFENIGRYFFDPVEIGRGTYGVVFKMTHIASEYTFALKIMKNNEQSRNEVKQTCKLSSINDLCYIFPFFIGWTFALALPKTFGTFKFTDKILLATQYFENTLEDTKLSDNDNRKIIFMLIYGVAKARKQLGWFEHSDIHIGNIMLYETEKATVFEFPEIGKIMSAVLFVPKLIDFDVTDTTKNPNVDYDSEFLTEIRNIIREMYVNQWTKEIVEFVGRMLSVSKHKSNEYENLFTVLKDPFFKNCVQDTNEIVNINGICITCYKHAKYVYNINDRFKFCSYECEIPYRAFRNAIKDQTI